MPTPAKHTVFLLTCGVVAATTISSPALAQNKGENPARRVGPPTLYSPPVERYRFGHTDVSNASFYPIPRGRITRQTYLDWLRRNGVLTLADNPRRGLSGPRDLLGALAQFTLTGDRKWGLACVEMLQDFRRALDREIETKGWTEQFAEPPAYIPLYREYLIRGGLLRKDSTWFRELWLLYARSLHVWASEPTEWRGPCHRSMPEALAKGLAAKWYPDIPEARRWKKYAAQVVDDFWRSKEILQNDTGYMQDSIRAYAFSGDLLLGDDRYLTDPGMQPLWERLAAEFTPDGAINPYGPNGGWNSTAAIRLAVLERLARARRDGRYRFVAHKAMNYLLYQEEETRSDGYLLHMETAPFIALAALFADDNLEPVEPEEHSRVSTRGEYVRIPHTDKKIVGKYLPDLDPHPLRAHLCCNQTFNGKVIPDKLVLRSGWKAGDLYALVELAPTTFPFNAGGIMGLNRWGAAMTQVVTSKGDTPENRLGVTDLSGKAPRRLVPDPDRIDEDWKRGAMPDVRSRVVRFRDFNTLTVAEIEVENPLGLPVRYRREFLFIKNGFLITREHVTFEESFRARLSALWNTQNIGPQIGTHWANTFVSAPIASNGRIAMKTPPVDLLVYFAPRDDWRLEVVDRVALDPRTEVCPAQLRYVWEGTPQAGQTLHSTQVLYPHVPFRARPSTNNIGAKAVYGGGDFAATAGAAGINVLIDTTETTLLRTSFATGLDEWLLLNPGGQRIEHESFASDARYAYIRLEKGSVKRRVLYDGTFLHWAGNPLIESRDRSSVEN